MTWQGRNHRVSYPSHGWDILPATGMGHTIPVTDRASHPIPVTGGMSYPSVPSQLRVGCPNRVLAGHILLIQLMLVTIGLYK